MWSKVPALALALFSLAQAPDPQRQLLDKLTGHWVLRGTIAKQQTTHDVDAVWVLDKEYVQIHEVSRERDAAGNGRSTRSEGRRDAVRAGYVDAEVIAYRSPTVPLSYAFTSIK